jgi:hypothetical protein
MRVLDLEMPAYSDVCTRHGLADTQQSAPHSLDEPAQVPPGLFPEMLGASLMPVRTCCQMHRLRSELEQALMYRSSMHRSLLHGNAW